ncbi:MAG: response regulator [Pseudorhodobacter sp.]|nr:response regulator [Pseudorhodobacter sp.]
MSDGSEVARFHVLLAEDDEVNQDIVRAFLADTGNLKLTIASDGREALEAAMLSRFDLMIIDQNMPHITGDRLIRHLRAGRTNNASTPVIRFTAEADARPPEIRIINGISEATLPKPLRKDALVSMITALLDIK